MATPDFSFSGSNPADVIGVLLDEIGIEFHQSAAHFEGMFLVNTEDDGFCEPIGIFEEIGEMVGNGLGPLAQCHYAFEVTGFVEFVGNLAAVAVLVFAAGTPAGGIIGRDYPMNTIRSEESILNALAKAIAIDRIA